MMDIILFAGYYEKNNQIAGYFFAGYSNRLC